MRQSRETWAAIVRVSHVGGRNGDSFHADEEQVGEIRRYAERHGATLVWMEPELSISGGAAIEDRPPLREAIEGVEGGDFEGIVVAYLSRLTRSRSGYQIWERVEAAGGHVHCARENLDTSTPTGRRFRDYAIADATAERETHAERHAERRRETVRAGIWRMRQTPRGYRRGDDRKLTPDDHADDVRWAFRARATGTSITEIATRLKMTTSGVRRLLENRVYLGELRDGRNLNPTAHTPLVTVAEFEAAQKPGTRPPRSGNVGPALLAGVVRCSGCGHRLTRGGSSRYPTYLCPAQHSGEPCPAPAAISLRLLDGYVEPIARRELERLSVTASDRDDVRDAEQRLADAEVELAAFLKVGRASDPGFEEAVDSRRDAVEAARADLRARSTRKPLLPAGASGADVWDSLSPHGRNQVLRSLLAAVVVARAGGPGAKMPVEDRVRVLAFGAPLEVPDRRGGVASGLFPIPLPDADAPHVLRPLAS